MYPMLKSTLAKAADVLPADSDKSSQQCQQDSHPTGMSFLEDISGPEGPSYKQRELLYSIAPISSYGAVRVVNPGTQYPPIETSWGLDHGQPPAHVAVEDSLFDKARVRNSIPSEPMFDFGPYAQYTVPLPRYQPRPLSIMSEMSIHSSPKGDDTIITMLSGGHVHRHSVSTLVEASFCAQVKGNKCTGRVL
ncbi:hypothetical protein C8Q70DRAFT_1068497 [Cubamyces menziesii]|nr:hypothetical protein C8Q70DRAFT_1068497 [Cubamyces menziesii]